MSMRPRFGHDASNTLAIYLIGCQYSVDTVRQSPSNLIESDRRVARAWRTLAILTGALTLSYVDRYLIAVCVQPIKTEFRLSDSAMGILTGFAFSAFYALFGLPIARLSDRGWRREVITWSIAVWSTMTALTGLVQNFAQMSVARFGVGAGEAGVFPTSQAMVSEVFPAARRTTALAILGAGGSLGLLIAFALGSWLEGRAGWRMTFLVMALPGLPLSLVAFCRLPRSVRLASHANAGLCEPLRLLWSERDFRHLPFAQSALVILLFGQAQWLPAFFERSFAASRVAIGTILGVSQALAIIAGMVLGGVLADRLRQRYSRGPLLLALLSIVAAGAPIALLYLTHQVRAAYSFAAIASFLLSVPAGPIAAHLQIIFPPHLRATASSGALVIASLLGLGGGPLIIGGLSDLLRDRFGQESLRYALMTTACFAILWATTHLVSMLTSSAARFDARTAELSTRD